MLDASARLSWAEAAWPPAQAEQTSVLSESTHLLVSARYLHRFSRRLPRCPRRLSALSLLAASFRPPLAGSPPLSTFGLSAASCVTGGLHSADSRTWTSQEEVALTSCRRARGWRVADAVCSTGLVSQAAYEVRSSASWMGWQAERACELTDPASRGCDRRQARRESHSVPFFRAPRFARETRPHQLATRV